MRPRRHRAGRARVALIALAIWLVGVELGPDLHLALHRHLAAHRHDGDAVVSDGGGRVRVHVGADHRHGPDGEDIWDEPSAAGPPTMGRAAERGVHSQAPHGQHSLAHRGLALAPPPPPVVTPFVAWTVRAATPPWRARIVSAPTVPPAAARGPPA